jgi:hypothetical protein
VIIHPDHDNWYYTDKYSALMAKSANAEDLKSFTERFLGSSPSESTGPISSGVEHLTCNEVVGGSNPSSGSNILRKEHS